MNAVIWVNMCNLVLLCDLVLTFKLCYIQDIIQVFSDLVIQNKLKLTHCDLILINNKGQSINNVSRKGGRGCQPKANIN